MARLDELEFDDLPQEEAHEFEVDLHCVVVLNHRFTLEGIDRSEEEDLAEIRRSFSRDHEAMSSEVSHVGIFYDELRQAANRLALVGLVTRLQHWIGKYVTRCDIKGMKTSAPLIVQLEALNGSLGTGPVPVAYFEELVNVRDSIIHADSKAEWKYKRARAVASCHRNTCGEVELNEAQLKEAIARAVQQVKWYDSRLVSRHLVGNNSNP